MNPIDEYDVDTKPTPITELVKQVEEAGGLSDKDEQAIRFICVSRLIELATEKGDVINEPTK